MRCRLRSIRSFLKVIEWSELHISDLDSRSVLFKDLSLIDFLYTPVRKADRIAACDYE